MIPAYHGEALLRWINAHGEAMFILDGASALMATFLSSGRTSQRYAMALMAIDDDGLPASRVPISMDMRRGVLHLGLSMVTRIEERPPSVQAALMAKDQAMRWYLYARRHEVPAGHMPTPREDDAVVWMREDLGVASRSELDSDSAPWRAMLGDFKEWIREELDVLKRET